MEKDSCQKTQGPGDGTLEEKKEEKKKKIKKGEKRKKKKEEEKNILPGVSRAG